MLEKCNWFCLTSLITLVLLMWKWMGLFLRKNHLLRCWGCLLFQIGLGLLHYLSGLYPSTFADLRFCEGLSFMAIGHCSWGFIWDEVVSIFSYVRLAWWLRLHTSTPPHTKWQYKMASHVNISQMSSKPHVCQPQRCWSQINKS